MSSISNKGLVFPSWFRSIKNMNVEKITYKELAELRRLLDSVDFLIDSEDEVSVTTYAKWEVTETNIVIEMLNNCKLRVYKKGGLVSKTAGRRSAEIRLPKIISLEEIISDESLDKKERAKLVWLLGLVENG